MGGAGGSSPSHGQEPNEDDRRSDMHQHEHPYRRRAGPRKSIDSSIAQKSQVR